MDMILITIAAFFVARSLVRSMEPTHYKHPKNESPLTVDEYRWYVQNNEWVKGYVPYVSILGILFKTKVEK